MSEGDCGSSRGTNFHRVAPIESERGNSSGGDGKSLDGVTSNGRDRSGAGYWGELPELVMDKIVAKLIENNPGRSCEKVLFSAAAVCRRWRESALRAIVQNLWKSDILFSHPAQLLALCPHAIPNGHVKCCLRRKTIANCFLGKRYMYSLHLENQETGMPGKFLMSAVQQSWQCLSIFFSQVEMNESCGTLTSNAWGYHYRLYKTNVANFEGVSSKLQIPALQDRMGSVTYRIKWKNLTRLGGVRHWDLFMDVKVPTTNPEKPILSLINNPPKWNQGLRCFSLDFRGRVKLASVKNFQLMKKHSATSNEEVVLQFGKVAQDTFILDFDPTLLSTFQAFAIALASFEAT